MLINIIEQYWDTIPVVSRRVRSTARNLVTRDFDVTLIQYDVLRQIYFGAHNLTEIAERQQRSRPAASLAVDQLVKKALVSRTEDAKDRRFVNLSLTVQGETLIKRIFKTNRAWMLEKMQNLTQDDLQILSNAFTIMKGTFTPE